MRQSGKLEGKVALVTGGASGIGLAIARRFLLEGAALVIADLSEEALVAAASGVAGPCTTVRVDVTRPADARMAVDAAITAYGMLDILVNNAGIARYSRFTELPLEEWEEVMAVNATGAFLVAQEAARAMTRRGAAPGANRCIINITSVEAHIVIATRGHPQVHYNASKGALTMLTRGLALDLASSNVRVNAIAPGIIQTGLTAQTLGSEETRRWVLERIPLGRVGQPDDIAAAAAFLASDDAAYITGTTIFVDGGWTVQ